METMHEESFWDKAENIAFWILIALGVALLIASFFKGG